MFDPDQAVAYTLGLAVIAFVSSMAYSVVGRADVVRSVSIAGDGRGRGPPAG